MHIRYAACIPLTLPKLVRLLCCRQLDSALLEPVITPRFIPTCTKELLKGLGQVAAETGVPVQSHISESLDEVAFAEHLHPEVSSAALQTGSWLLQLHAAASDALAENQPEHSDAT